MSLFSGLKERLRDGLKRSQEYLATGLASVLEDDRPIDDALYEELEELLVAADLGATIAADFTNRAREEVMFGTVTRAAQLRPLFRRFLVDALKPAAQPLGLDARPSIVLMLGVNGAGKTTTAAKLAASLKADGQQVLLAAADTFRAAAIEQLETWGARIGVDVIRQAAGSDQAGRCRRARRGSEGLRRRRLRGRARAGRRRGRTLVSPEALMRRALELAERGRGVTSPNPMVGAIVVVNGEIVGEGFHERAGGPHAEVLALDAAGARARGATLYVTLEPCNHVGR